MAEERLLWEDLNEGDTAISAGRIITETDVVNFCRLSGDFNWSRSKGSGRRPCGGAR